MDFTWVSRRSGDGVTVRQQRRAPVKTSDSMAVSPERRMARKQVQRFGQGELFADERRGKPAAAHLAAGFHAAQHDQQFAPCRRQRLADGGIAEHHAPTLQKLPGEGLGASSGARSGMAQQRPTAGRVARTRGAALAFAAAALGVEQGAQILESVGGHQPGGDQLPKRILHFAGQASGGARQIGEERSAARFQHVRGPRGRGATASPWAKAAASASSQPASSRRKIASGATRVGRTRRPRPVSPSRSRSNAGCGERRPQLTSPDRQSWSR